MLLGWGEESCSVMAGTGHDWVWELLVFGCVVFRGLLPAFVEVRSSATAILCGSSRVLGKVSLR